MLTGNYYLLYLTIRSDDNTFIILDYSTNSTSLWDPDLTNPKLTPYSGELPTLETIITLYAKDNYYTPSLLPLTSPYSALTDYPELFI